MNGGGGPIKGGGRKGGGGSRPINGEPGDSMCMGEGALFNSVLTNFSTENLMKYLKE